MRYSREDLAEMVEYLAHEADLGLGGHDKRVSMVPCNKLRVAAAMLSEAANRTPTHAELVAEMQESAEW